MNEILIPIFIDEKKIKGKKCRSVILGWKLLVVDERDDYEEENFAIAINGHLFYTHFVHL